MEKHNQQRSPCVARQKLATSMCACVVASGVLTSFITIGLICCELGLNMPIHLCFALLKGWFVAQFSFHYAPPVLEQQLAKTREPFITNATVVHQGPAEYYQKCRHLHQHRARPTQAEGHTPPRDHQAGEMGAANIQHQWQTAAPVMASCRWMTSNHSPSISPVMRASYATNRWSFPSTMARWSQSLVVTQLLEPILRQHSQWQRRPLCVIPTNV